jgi:hypothetical protein
MPVRELVEALDSEQHDVRLAAVRAVKNSIIGNRQKKTIVSDSFVSIRLG